jgi:2-desacetyl-2-hydroxyethyl bacteriochlorophyllide A dehydrogenase
MKTLILREPGSLVLESTALPTAPAAGEALVRVHRVGVCGTDIHAYRGKQPFFTYPRILGHELGVEVLAVGDGVTNVKAGDRCSVEPYMNCGSCIACRNDRGNCCTNLQVIGVHADGGMREQFTLRASKLHPSDTLSYEQLALVETLGIGAHAVQRAGVKRDEYVLVIGAGPIGLSAMQFAVEAGARTIVVDINDQRLEFCQRQLGVSHVINGQWEDVLQRLVEITNGDLPTVALDATGNPASMKQAFNYPAHGGRLVFIGLFPGEVSFDDPNFHRRELTLLASRNSAPEDFRHIIRAIEEGRIDTRPWITHRANAEEVPGLFESWTQPETGVLKAIIEF